MKEEKTEKLTKVKNPGRVESGRRLAEYNRENKKKLRQQELSQVPSQEPSKEPKESVQVPSELIFLVVGGAVVYFIIKQQSAGVEKVKNTVVDKPFDPFRK